MLYMHDQGCTHTDIVLALRDEMGVERTYAGVQLALRIFKHNREHGNSERVSNARSYSVQVGVGGLAHWVYKCLCWCRIVPF